MDATTAMLAAAIPAASQLIAGLGHASRQVGTSFRDLLGMQGPSSEASPAGTSHVPSHELETKLTQLVDEIREWMRQQNVGDEYQLSLKLDPAGQSHLEWSGKDSADAALAAGNLPSLLQRLEQLAGSLQIQRASDMGLNVAGSLEIAFSSSELGIRSGVPY